MAEKVFCDTCVTIAQVFHINSLHLRSNDVFNSYSEYYWSNFVKEEYERRFDEKLKNLSKFFQDFKLELENPNQEFFSLDDLTKYASKNYSGKIEDDAISSISPFWNTYIGIESQISFNYLKNNIDDCLNDLLINTEINGSNLETKMILTPERKRKYRKIDSILKSKGVKKADRTVTLDGHDFACFNSSPVDFVTFDDACFNGASNVEALCFESVKGKYDFAS